MAKDAIKALKIHKRNADGILQAGRQEDAQSFLDTWRLNNLGTKKSGVLPPVDAVPPHLRGIIFKRADASQTNTSIAQDLQISPQNNSGGGWEYLGPEQKKKIKWDEWQADIIKGLEEGRILPEDAKRMLGDDPAAEEIINKFNQQHQQKQSLKIGSTQLASAKTPNQQAKSDVINSIKKLTKEGKHNEAQALYREQFGRV